MYKNFLFVVSFVWVTALVFIKPAGFFYSVSVFDDLSRQESSFIEYEQTAAILYEPNNSGFSARIKKTSGKDNTNIFERELKNKFSIRKNLCFEYHIGKYIHSVKLSAHYIRNLPELRRLNI